MVSAVLVDGYDKHSVIPLPLTKSIQLIYFSILVKTFMKIHPKPAGVCHHFPPIAYEGQLSWSRDLTVGLEGSVATGTGRNT